MSEQCLLTMDTIDIDLSLDSVDTYCALDSLPDTEIAVVSGFIGYYSVGYSIDG